MTVRIRLESTSPAEIAATEGALRRVLDIPDEASRDYRNHDGAGLRRYVVSNGVREAETGEERRAPLAVADDAKRARDIGGEIGALMGAHQDLLSQPWMPLQGGDIILSFLPGSDGVPDYGTTYLAVPDEFDEAGCRLKFLSRTPPEEDASEDWLESFQDLWFESPPDDVVVIRGGAVVHGSPARVVVRAVR